MHNAPAPTAVLPPLEKAQYEALSTFRYQLRRFLHFSEQAVKAEGLTSLQYQLLLHVRGFPGRDWATVGELAERLQIQPHGAVALLTRCEQGGWVMRRKGGEDRRQVQVYLLGKGRDCLERLASLHEKELRALQGTFQVANITSFNNTGDDTG